MKKTNKQNISENRSCAVLHSVLHSPRTRSTLEILSFIWRCSWQGKRPHAAYNGPISTITLRYDTFYMLPSLAPISFRFILVFFLYECCRTKINETRVALALQHLFSISSFWPFYRVERNEFVSIFLAHVTISERSDGSNAIPIEFHMCNANAIKVHRINEISHATDLVAVLLCARRQQLAFEFFFEKISKAYGHAGNGSCLNICHKHCLDSASTQMHEFLVRNQQSKLKSSHIVWFVLSEPHRRLLMIGTLTLNCQMPSSYAASILNGMSNEHCLRSASAYVLSGIEFWARLKAEKTYDVSINLARCVPIVFRVRCENRQCVSED